MEDIAVVEEQGAVSAPPGVDPTRPSIARAYDAYLGGKDNFAVDRRVVRKTDEVLPEVSACARANRAFLRRVVRYLVGEAGIDQFIDLGSGLPSAGNVHEVAQAIDPRVRVVYADNDPMVLAHGRALLGANDTTTVITRDVRRPREVLADPEVGKYVDFGRPLGLLLFAILHHINDGEDPGGIARVLREALPSGSFLAISHFCDVSREYPDEAKRTAATEKIFNELLGTGRWRRREEIAGYLGDFELVEPGLVPLQDWRPDPNDPGEPFAHHWLVGGVARKR
jgi:S-adenosyl methyltransferase